MLALGDLYDKTGFEIVNRQVRHYYTGSLGNGDNQVSRKYMRG